MAAAGRHVARAHDGCRRVTVAVELPAPCLVVLVGAAGSGKSTLAARLFAPDQVLASDAYRGIVSGDEADQGATQAAFRRLHGDLHRRLAERRTTVVDATNVTAFARRSLTRIAARHGVPAVAIVLDLPPELVQARNRSRSSRIVPWAAVDRQLADLDRSLHRDDLAKEGFAQVVHLRTAADVGALTIVDAPPAVTSR
jgi:predicted kinase